MKLAWATKSQSNGFIARWSRWHLSDDYEVTKCGKRIPHTKVITGEKDYRIQGGECKACKLIQ